jgi:hypothetical protein
MLIGKPFLIGNHCKVVKCGYNYAVTDYRDYCNIWQGSDGIAEMPKAPLQSEIKKYANRRRRPNGCH